MAGIGAFRSLGIVAGVAAFSVPSVLNDMKTAEQEHKSKLWAGTKSAVAYNWQNVAMIGWGGFKQLRGMVWLGVLSAAAPITSGILTATGARNRWIRQAATPFSHSFQMSDWAAASQQRGMQTITGVRSLIGSEAASLNARYGRR